jgi:hypothetical protein
MCTKRNGEPRGLAVSQPWPLERAADSSETQLRASSRSYPSVRGRLYCAYRIPPPAAAGALAVICLDHRAFQGGGAGELPRWRVDGSRWSSDHSEVLARLRVLTSYTPAQRRQTDRAIVAPLHSIQAFSACQLRAELHHLVSSQTRLLHALHLPPRTGTRALSGAPRFTPSARKQRCRRAWSKWQGWSGARPNAWALGGSGVVAGAGGQCAAVARRRRHCKHEGGRYAQASSVRRHGAAGSGTAAPAAVGGAALAP